MSEVAEQVVQPEATEAPVSMETPAEVAQGGSGDRKSVV